MHDRPPVRRSWSWALVVGAGRSLQRPELFSVTGTSAHSLQRPGAASDPASPLLKCLNALSACSIAACAFTGVSSAQFVFAEPRAISTLIRIYGLWMREVIQSRVGTIKGSAAFRVLGAWVLASLVLHLAWELAQLPFYTVWREASPAVIAWAVVHCTAGDGLIALGTYLAAACAARSIDWPWAAPGRGLAALWASGLAWTVFSEWRHVFKLGSWAYVETMPTVAGIGVAPLLQWVVVPGLALWCLREWDPRPSRSAPG